MPGPKLCSARVGQYRALGERGRPLYMSASRVLAVIERELPDLAYCFAVPRLSDDDSWIDWYAPEPGTVDCWGEITALEQEEARSLLVGVRREIIKLQRSLQDSDYDDDRSCRDLLAWMFHHPDASHRFLVNGRPVLAFWGFVHIGASASQDPLDFSAAHPPDFAQPQVHHAAPRASAAGAVPWWRRGWLWLLLLLVVLVSFFGLPSLPDLPTLPNPEPASAGSSSQSSTDQAGHQCLKSWGWCATRGWRPRSSD